MNLAGELADGMTQVDSDNLTDASIRRPLDASTSEIKCDREHDISSIDETADEPAADVRNEVAGGMTPDIKLTKEISTAADDDPTLSTASPTFSQKKLPCRSTNQVSFDGAARSASTIPRFSPKKSESNFSKSNNTSNTDNNKGKNAFDAFGEYISFFFQKAEVYEQELERRESKKDVLDKFRHGTLSTRILTPTFPEGEDEFANSEGTSFDDTRNENQEVRSSTPLLSETLEALAAVEAISSFREFKDVKLELRESFNCDNVDLETMKEEVVDETPPDSSTEEWKNQWERFVVEKSKTKLGEVAIQKISLPLSVDKFYNHVIADNAAHSFGKFMRSIGEKRVDTTPWLPSHTLTSAGPASRNIHYTHPITAPLAPPMAKALKRQVLHKFGNAGLCLETCTEVEDVPMADCFVVEDRLWVHAAEDNNEECIVSVRFGIRFIKGTLFRRIIENATRKEYATFWDQFADMIRVLKLPISFDGEELQKVAIELEHATELLLESEGREVHMSSVLRSSIRTLSRRLSLATNVQSNRQLLQIEEREELTEGALPFALRGMEYIRNRVVKAGSPFVVVCLLCFFMCYLNIVASRQIMKMNELLQTMDTRLDKMIEKLEETHAIADKSCVLFS